MHNQDIWGHNVVTYLVKSSACRRVSEVAIAYTFWALEVLLFIVFLLRIRWERREKLQLFTYILISEIWLVPACVL